MRIRWATAPTFAMARPGARREGMPIFAVDWSRFETNLYPDETSRHPESAKRDEILRFASNEHPTAVASPVILSAAKDLKMRRLRTWRSFAALRMTENRRRDRGTQPRSRRFLGPFDPHRLQLLVQRAPRN